MSVVLVTGATAPLGQALVRALLTDGHTVLATGREPASALPPSPGFHYVSADLSRSRDLRRLLFGPAQSLGVTSLIHTALHLRSDTDGDRAHRLAVDATHELVHLCERHSTIRQLVLRSYSEVYRVRPSDPSILDEEHALDLDADTPQWIRDRAHADLATCARMAMTSLRVVVLRLAECVAEGTGSQLADWLTSRVCFYPLGFDPLLGLLSLDDAVAAFRAALRFEGHGVFNIPGADLLPLSSVIRRAGRIGVPAPAMLLRPLYGLRAIVLGSDFRWALNRWRFHLGAVLDGTRARALLGYEPHHPIVW